MLGWDWDPVSDQATELIPVSAALCVLCVTYVVCSLVCIISWHHIVIVMHPHILLGIHCTPWDHAMVCCHCAICSCTFEMPGHTQQMGPYKKTSFVVGLLFIDLF